MAPVSSLFLISLLYTFSKIQETIWKSGKLEWRGQYFLFFPDVPDFQIISCLREERLFGTGRNVQYPTREEVLSFGF